MRILIVDSSIQIIERLEEILSESAIVTEVFKSVSYEGAVTLFKQYQPDIVLLDIYLPGNDSISLLKEIKRSGFKTFVIILTAQTDSYMREQFRSLGVDLFFDKYHDFEKIPGFISSISNKNIS